MKNREINIYIYIYVCLLKLGVKKLLWRIPKDVTVEEVAYYFTWST